VRDLHHVPAFFAAKLSAFPSGLAGFLHMRSTSLAERNLRAQFVNVMNLLSVPLAPLFPLTICDIFGLTQPRV